MKLFLDTNVILDFLAAREPWSFDAARIFAAAEVNQVSLHTTLVSMVNCLFILKSRYGRTNNAEIILESLDFIKIIATTEATFKKALISGFTDKEDAIQYFSALDQKDFDYILTRDAKGFSQCTIPVLTPAQFVAQHLSAK